MKTSQRPDIAMAVRDVSAAVLPVVEASWRFSYMKMSHRPDIEMAVRDVSANWKRRKLP